MLLVKILSKRVKKVAKKKVVTMIPVGTMVGDAVSKIHHNLIQVVSEKMIDES